MFSYPPNNPSKNPTSHRLTLILGATLGLSTLVGCSSNQVSMNESQQGELDHPVALQPEGSMQATGMPADLVPDPIDLSDPSAIVRTTVTPTIIDTYTFANKHQLTGPFTGEIKMIKNQLIEHHRDKTLPAGTTDRSIPVGHAVDVDRVHINGSTGFPGISQTEWSPPDPTLAVGPNHIVETVNSAIAFYDKNGNETFSSPLGDPGTPGFFETVGANSNFVFDPKCYYDQKVGRFVVIALEQIGTESWIDIAVSDDSNPNGIWYKYRTFSAIAVSGSTYWVDYPGFGFDDNAFYVTGNLFLLTGGGSGFGGQLFRIFDKAPMLVGDPVVITDMAPNTGASLQVAQMFGSAPQCYFVSRDTSTALRIWTINNPLTSPSIQSIAVGGLASATGPSQDAPNRFGGLLSTLDGRLMNVHVRDGNLYTGHAIDGAPGITVARWYHFDLQGWPNSGSNPVLVQQGDVSGSSGQHHFFPAIYSDRFDNVGMIMAQSSSTEFASVQVSGRTPSDPAGTMSAPIQLAIGDTGTSGRWGDYLDIAMDPNDDTTFWIMGMYAKNFGWQTYIDSFTIAADCAPDFNGDGVLNFFDISAFLSAFNASDPSADINGDGAFNFFDISSYLTLFSAGCP